MAESVVARDWTVMRRLSVRKIEQDFIDIAPAPAFRRIVALDDWMLGGVEVLGGMLVGGIVAAADVTATAADPQMQPLAAALEAFLATKRARRDIADAGDVSAAFCHPRPLPYSAGFAASPRKPCNAATTCAPSPIAPPTRLTEPERTSPTANTPGTDVSSAEASCPPFLHSSPVTTKPPRSTITPQPSSQPVAGSAPTNRNRLRMSMVLCSPDSRLRRRTRSSEPSSAPSIPTTSVLNTSSILDVASMRSIRYRDMLAPRPPPRITR